MTAEEDKAIDDLAEALKRKIEEAGDSKTGIASALIGTGFTVVMRAAQQLGAIATSIHDLAEATRETAKAQIEIKLAIDNYTEQHFRTVR